MQVCILSDDNWLAYTESFKFKRSWAYNKISIYHIKHLKELLWSPKVFIYWNRTHGHFENHPNVLKTKAITSREAIIVVIVVEIVTATTINIIVIVVSHSQSNNLLQNTKLGQIYIMWVWRFLTFLFCILFATVYIISILILTEKKGIRFLKHILLLRSPRAPKIKVLNCCCSHTAFHMNSQ